MKKSTVEEIRARFDKDVERFSNLETGQSATIDALLTLDLIAACAAGLRPDATSILDIGCGAGNFTLKLTDVLPQITSVTLIDLSRPMLDRAAERVQSKRSCQVCAVQTDIREAMLGDNSFDIVVAAAVLHHLRDDDEWLSVFSKIYRCLRPRGAFFISDLVSHSNPDVQRVMWQRYGDYLTGLKGPEYREHVFNYIDYEDTPRSVTFQLDTLHAAGFTDLDVIHKNSCFAALVGVK